MRASLSCLRRARDRLSLTCTGKTTNLFLSNCEPGKNRYDDQQPEITPKTGIIYISGTTADSVKIPTSNNIIAVKSFVKLSPRDCDNEQQPEMARLAPKRPNRLYCHFTVVDRCCSRRWTLAPCWPSLPWSTTSYLPLELRCCVVVLQIGLLALPVWRPHCYFRLSG